MNNSKNIIKIQNSASSSSASASFGWNSDLFGTVKTDFTSPSAKLFHITINSDSSFIFKGKLALYSKVSYSFVNIIK